MYVKYNVFDDDKLKFMFDFFIFNDFVILMILKGFVLNL